MTFPSLTLWLAGMMLGLGSGLVLASCLTETDPSADSSHVLAQQLSSASTEVESTEEDYLHTPLSSPADTSHRAQKSRLPEPRLLPSSDEALPVPQSSGLTAPTAQAIPQAATMPATSAAKTPVPQGVDPAKKERTDFREHLEGIAPEFPLEALDELEKIRSVIEGTPAEDVPAENDTPKPDSRPAK